MKAAGKRTVQIELPGVSPELLARLKEKGVATLDRLSEEELTGVWEWSRSVIRAYRSILETDPKNVRDISELPFEKDDIKLAIKIALPLYVSKDLQRMIRALKNAYKELGAFQDLDSTDTENTTLSNHLPDFLSGDGNMSRDRTNADMGLIVSEKKALTEEINSFVGDLEALV